MKTEPTASFHNRVDLHSLIPSPDAIDYLPEDAAKRLLCVPLAIERDEKNRFLRLVIATESPEDESCRERLLRQLPSGIQLRLVPAMPASIPFALNKCYGGKDQGKQLLEACATNFDNSIGVDESSDRAVRLVESILREAFSAKASDIHISPTQQSLVVRMRVDGVLTLAVELRKEFATAISGRIKVLAMLDIAESRTPQDGQFSSLVDGSNVDFRVSTFPTIYGENIVIRLLRSQEQTNTLQSLGLDANSLESLRLAVHQPQGLIVICGPTGSGKSTSLYALLDELDHQALNIMTLEDPVERFKPSIRQTSIDAARSFDYVEGIRALLRQDPDVLLIGEVRDTPSALIMMRAVMTGHRVLTTIHASDVFGAIDRFLELGVSRDLLSANLKCIASQRLIRKNCQCYRQQVVDCALCGGSGYLGRSLVMELLKPTTKLTELIRNTASLEDLSQEAFKSGFIPMQESARLMVAAGHTRLEEYQRVFGPHVSDTG